MGLFDGQMATNAFPVGQQFTGGPQTGFAQNFSAAFADTYHVRAAYGLDDDFAKLEQQNLDKIFALTGQRMSPLVQGSWTTPQDGASAVMHGLAGDQLAAAQQQQYAAAQAQMDKVKDIAQRYPGVLNYDQMFGQLRAQAKQYADTATDDYSRSTFTGALGSFAGGAIGSLSPDRDPINFASLALGGVGKTAIARIASEIGLQGVAQAVELMTGSYEKQKLLNQTPTGEQMAEQVIGGALGAGAFRAAGEGLAAGFGAIARRFGAQAPDVTAAALSKEAHDAIGLSPHGESRVAEGLHTNQVLDVIQHDTPLNLPGLEHADYADFVGPPQEKPIDVVNRKLAEAMPEDTQRLAAIDQTIDSITKDRKALADQAADNEQFGDVRKAFAQAQDLDERYQRLSTAADKASSDAQRAELQGRMADIQNKVKEIFGGLDPDKVNKLDDLEAGVSLRDQKLADARAEREPVAGRLDAARKQLIDQYWDEARNSARNKPAPSQSDEIEKTLEARPKTVEPPEPPKTRVLPPPEPKTEAEAAARPERGEKGSGETIELGQRSGPADLDMKVIHGFDEEGEPKFASIREILEEHKADQDLVNSMKSCLLQ